MSHYAQYKLSNNALRPWSKESNISSSSNQHLLALLCLTRCCSAPCGQTNTTFRSKFLEFRYLCDVNRWHALVFKLFLGVRFWNCVKPSKRESSELDRVVKNEFNISPTSAQQHLKLKKCSPNIFEVLLLSHF